MFNAPRVHTWDSRQPSDGVAYQVMDSQQESPCWKLALLMVALFILSSLVGAWIAQRPDDRQNVPTPTLADVCRADPNACIAADKVAQADQWDRWAEQAREDELYELQYELQQLRRRRANPAAIRALEDEIAVLESEMESEEMELDQFLVWP